MYNKRIGAGLLVASLMTGCASLTGTGSVDNPPDQVNIANTQELRVQLVPQGEGARQANDQPAAFTPQQLSTLLNTIRLKTADGGEATFTSPSRIRTLADDLSRALARAGPHQDVLFVVFRRVGAVPIIGTSRRYTTARVFYRDHALNVIFGRLDAPYSEFRDMSINPFQYGARATPSRADATALVANGSWRWHGDRRDWIELPATAAAIQAAERNTPQAIETSAGGSAEPLQYGPAGAAARTMPEGKAAAGAATGATDSALSNTTVPQASTGAWDKIEKRLSELKKLRDKGLISARDYQQKKDQLLQQLP